MVRLSLRGGVALVQRDGDPVEQGVRDGALALERQVRPRSVGGQDRHAVGVGPEARAGLSHVVRDEQVDALAPELVGGALERARLRGEPDQDRDRLQRLARGGAVAVEAVGDPGDLGEEVRGGLELERQVVGARELGLGGGDRPEVGHGGGHDQGVEAGGAGSDRWVEAQQRGAQLGGRARPGRPWPPGGSATSTFAATTVTRAPRSSAASAIAAPIRPVERLPMKRTGSIASRVPPAVTTTWRPVRSASRAGPTSGGRAAGSGARTADAADGRHDRVDDRPELGQPADPVLAGGQRTGPGLDDRVAEASRSRATLATRGRMRPHVAVHGRCDDDRRARSRDTSR